MSAPEATTAHVEEKPVDVSDAGVAPTAEASKSEEPAVPVRRLWLSFSLLINSFLFPHKGRGARCLCR